MHYRIQQTTAALCWLGLPLVPLNQFILNAAARLMFNLHKFSHVILPLSTLHWLPVKARIIFKAMVLANRAARGTAPPYLQAMFKPYIPTRALRSTTLCGDVVIILFGAYSV
jgi:hypothetical protein